MEETRIQARQRPGRKKDHMYIQWLDEDGKVILQLRLRETGLQHVDWIELAHTGSSEHSGYIP